MLPCAGELPSASAICLRAHFDREQTIGESNLGANLEALRVQAMKANKCLKGPRAC